MATQDGWALWHKHWSTQHTCLFPLLDILKSVSLRHSLLPSANAFYSFPVELGNCSSPTGPDLLLLDLHCGPQQITLTTSHRPTSTVITVADLLSLWPIGLNLLAYEAKCSSLNMAIDRHTHTNPPICTALLNIDLFIIFYSTDCWKTWGSATHIKGVLKKSRYCHWDVLFSLYSGY